MSKIGKTPIAIKEGVTVAINNGTAVVAGPKGTLSFVIPANVSVKQEESLLLVSEKNAGPAIFGLTRAILANMVKGVSEGFEKKLELTGVGYRAQVQGRDLTLSLGFSHPVKVPAAEGIAFTVVENTITISGIDKTLVGDVASKIRAIRPPEPYKGKGIKYMGERIRRKAGKAAKAVGAK